MEVEALLPSPLNSRIAHALQTRSIVPKNGLCNVLYTALVGRKRVAQPKTNRALRRFHAQGKRALQELRRIKLHGERIHGSLAKLGAKTPTAKNRLIEARRFAELYDDEQLNWLCALGQGKGQRPLTKPQVIQLIRVDNRKQRNALARKCAAESWSARKLELEIALILPRRRYSGRPLEVPRSVDKTLVVTERILRSLIRWINVLSLVESKTGNRPMDKLPRPIPQKLHEISTEAEELETLCAKKRGQRAKAPS